MKLKKMWPLVYLVFVIKMLVFYWQTGMLDMLAVYDVPVLTVLFLAAVFELFSLKDNRAVRITFYCIYSIITLIMFADAAYSGYFGKYTSVNQLYQLASLGQIARDGGVLEASVSPLCLLTLLDVPIVFYCYRQRMRNHTPLFSLPVKKLVLRTAAYTVLFAAAVGSWIYYGFNPSNLRGIQKVNHIEFFTCHTNDILVNVVGKMHRQEADREAILKTMKENVPASSGDRYRGVAKGKNLILIQTESLNDFVIGAQYNGQEITPNLNRLRKEDTLYFNHFYSTTGVGNTCDAEFSTLNSLYANEERECYRMYVDNAFNGLPWLLRGQGYEATAFHGYIKTFWNRNEAYKNQGFQHFYSEEELDITEESGFGLTDKELFRQAVDILKKRQGPFFSFMITLTNHIPYELDPKLATLTLKDEDKGSTFGNYLQTVRYTDEAFGDLISYLKEAGLYEDTMIMIYGDHQGMNKETPSVMSHMSSFLGKPYDFDEMLNVPLFIHIPGLGESRTVTTAGGQVDILPTIANLMDFDIPQPYIFGHDLLNTEDGFVAQISYVGKNSFISDDNNMLFVIGKDGTVESGRLLDLANGERMNLNVDLCRKYSDRAAALLDTCREVLDYNLIADYVEH
ncbi:MAG: LTA synthase family protein [Eubacterium sp.]|nr:LTA synthase family protein [Eubacterium sp.]